MLPAVGAALTVFVAALRFPFSRIATIVHVGWFLGPCGCSSIGARACSDQLVRPLLGGGLSDGCGADPPVGSPCASPPRTGGKRRERQISVGALVAMLDLGLTVCRRHRGRVGHAGSRVARLAELDA